MARKKSEFEELRAKAERVLSDDPGISFHPARADLEDLIHELDVHRVELEIQNEELRLSQERLQESNSRYFELYDLAPSAFLTVSPVHPHQVLGANSMACQVLGVARTELLGKPFTRFAAEDGLSLLHGFIRKARDSEERLTAEVRMRCETPSLELQARIQAVRIVDPKEGDRLLVALSDITDQIKARQVLQRDRDELEMAVQSRTAELEAANRQLERKNRELQDFAFIASHDLREPIRKVMVFGDLLRNRLKGRLDEKELDYFSRMKKANDRMERMLASLLEYSRLESRVQPFEMVNLNEILDQVRSNLREEIQGRNAKLEVGNLPVLRAEPQQMQQLFQNLISNALKYSARPPEITTYAEDGRDRCTIYVVDNGIGFDTKYLDKIFTPFQRLHGRDAYEGTGMGLTICRKIVEYHQGGITATSTPGQGSVFIVTLPYRQED